ncbi:extracellular solute-binding protein [Melioribacter sp. Ez-97]|jgi:multiple sugar transport system substrate-binding protein|uniref:extracellular solute-binding protein n=1 Tax=Melioribacter sp. Ez-97 TaxID=3423434 RepID=UPI003EDB21B8
MKEKNRYLTTFYFSITAITFFAVSVFIFTTLFGDLLVTDNKEPVKIYFADNISPSHKSAIEKFNRLYKGEIEVIPVDLPFEKFTTNERKELLIRYLRGKSERLDIFSVDQIWVPRFAKFATPLGEYFTSIEREEIVPEALQSCYYNGQFISVPLFFDIGVMYYRKDKLKKLPGYPDIKKKLDSSITWNEFITLGERISQSGSPYYLFAGDAYEGLMCSFMELIASQNGSLLENGKIKINTTESRRAIALLRDLIYKYKLTPPEVTNFTENESYAYYVRNDGFFLRSWPGFITWYRNNVDSRGDTLLFGRAPIPRFDGGKSRSTIGGWYLMLSKYSEKKKEAAKFIKFLLNNDIQKEFYYSGYLPVTESVYSDSSFIKKNPDIEFYYSLLKNAVRRPFVEKYTRYSDVISYHINRALKNKISVNEALTEIERIINSEIETGF